MGKKIHYNYLSKKGSKNKVNEDSFAVPMIEGDFKINSQQIEQKGYFFVVCDGLGGHNRGDVASSLCSKHFIEDYYAANIWESTQEWLNNEIDRLNHNILKKSTEDEEYSNMGTTLINLLIKDDTAYINNVGDSRVYLYNGKKLEQITEDHSVVWGYYKNNLIEKDDIINQKNKNILTQSIGVTFDTKINSYEIKLPENFIFLLCSDGLTDVTLDKEIEEIISQSDNLETCINSLYEISQKHESKDDVTIILVSNY